MSLGFSKTKFLQYLTVTVGEPKEIKDKSYDFKKLTVSVQ